MFVVIYCVFLVNFDCDLGLLKPSRFAFCLSSFCCENRVFRSIYMK